MLQDSVRLFAKYFILFFAYKITLVFLAMLIFVVFGSLLWRESWRETKNFVLELFSW